MDLTKQKGAAIVKSVDSGVGAAAKYHDVAYPGDTLTYSYILSKVNGVASQSRPPSEERLRLILNGYLRDWCGLTRILDSEPEEDSDKVLMGLKDVLSNRWESIRDLSSASIGEDLSSAQRSKLVSTFNDFDSGWEGLAGEAKRSPVAVAKLLHMLLPGLCVIWDREHVLNRWFEDANGGRVTFQDSAESYAKYIEFKAEQLRLIATNAGSTVGRVSQTLVDRHVKDVARKFPIVSRWIPEPITKILDEWNYDVG